LDVLGATGGAAGYANVYKRWKIGNIGYIVERQELKWQQIGNTIGNNRQQPSRGSACHRSSACHWGKVAGIAGLSERCGDAVQSGEVGFTWIGPGRIGFGNPGAFTRCYWVILGRG